jgi:hypothetical protein
MTEQEAAKLLYIITSAYPGKGPRNKDELDGYLYSLRLVLEEVPFKVAEAAVRKVLSTHTFFPVPAEIYQAAMSFRLDKPPAAEAAWAEVRKVITSGHLAIEYYYNGQMPQWSHPLIGKTVSRIGLREMFESENMGILMAQFIRVYNNYREEEREESLNAQILRLAGIDRLMLTEKEKQYGSH